MNRTEYGSYTHPDDPGEPATGAPRISVTEEEAQLLAWLAVGRRVLEIGTGLGISTQAMANRQNIVTSIDNDPWVQENIWPILSVYSINFLTERPKLGVFDMVFIDGEHSTAEAKADIEYAHRVCKRGMIVVHDSKMESVETALDCFDWYQIPTYHGIGIIYVGWQ